MTISRKVDAFSSDTVSYPFVVRLPAVQHLTSSCFPVFRQVYLPSEQLLIIQKRM